MLLILLAPLPAIAGQSSKLPRIGVLDPQGASQMEEHLCRGLRDLGYVEGRNIAIEWRRGAASQDAARAQAADLAKLNVQLIVALGTPATRAALEGTPKPVVMQVGDPVRSGFATSPQDLLIRSDEVRR